MGSASEPIAERDFSLLLNAAPHPYLVLRPDYRFTIVAVNDRYLAATGSTREAIVGHGLFDIFPDHPTEQAGRGVADLRSSLQRVLRDQVQDVMGVQRYDIPRRSIAGNPDGTFETRYWSPVNTPVFDESRHIVFIIHHVEDITEFVQRHAGLDSSGIPAAEAGTSPTKRVEAEILRRASEVGDANRQLKAANEALESSKDDLTQLNVRLSEIARSRSEDFSTMSRQFSLLVETVTDYAIILLDPSGIVTSWNQGAERIKGYRAEEIIGLHFSRFYSEQDRERGHPGEVLAAAASTGRFEEEGWRVRKDGSRFWAKIVVSALYAENGVLSGFGKVVRDLSEQKRVQATLDATLALQSAILDSANVSIIATDPDGTILSINRAAQRMLGYTESDLIGRRSLALLHDAAELQLRAGQLSEELGRPIAPTIEVFLAVLQSNRADEREWTYLHRNGSRIPVMLSMTAIRDGSGSLTGLLGIASDISDRRQKEEAITAALAEKETLLKEVYHRVKNNMQVITSLLSLQLDALPEGPAHDALRDGADRVRAMALVHEKLYQSTNLSSIVLGDYVADLCGQLGLASAAVDRCIAIASEADPIQVDLETAIPLGLLLNELVSNSLKHAFPDGRAGEIRVRLRRCDDKQALLEVMDNGVGFPQGIASRFSLSLGLHLIQTLSKQLDGRFTMDNREGAYSSLRFPLATPIRARR